MPTWRCLNGDVNDGHAHDFHDVTSTYIVGTRPVIYCRRCGEVRPLELPPEPELGTGIHRITVSNASTAGGHS